MKKYRIYEDFIEVIPEERKEIRKGIILKKTYPYPELLSTHDNLEEAEKELAKYQTMVEWIGDMPFPYFKVTERYIKEVDLDEVAEEEAELSLAFSKPLAFSKLVIIVINESTDEVVGFFDNLEDAEKAANESIFSKQKKHIFSVINSL